MECRFALNFRTLMDHCALRKSGRQIEIAAPEVLVVEPCPGRNNVYSKYLYKLGEASVGENFVG
jgi:hypothetical protein